jgi:uncharacterized protein with PQ loop repeat
MADNSGKEHDAVFGNSNTVIAAGANDSKSEFVEVTWMRTLKICWSLFWMEMVFVLIASVISGVIIGVLSVSGVDKKGPTMISNVVTGILDIPVSLIILRYVLKKKYSDFRIALIKR